MSDKVPKLTLTTGTESNENNNQAPQLEIKTNEPVKEAPEASLDINKLTPEEKQAVLDFIPKIDIRNTNLVLEYGSEAQTKISSFSNDILGKVRTKDSGEIGNMLTGLVTEIKSLDVTEKKGGVMGFFRDVRDSANKAMVKYDKVENNVDKIVVALEGHKTKLMLDIKMFDEMFETNLDYFKNLSLYIIAGDEKLKEMNNVVLPELMKKAKETNDQTQIQEVNDMLSLINRFEKKIHDLKLSRMVSLQMGPQIRLIQNNDTQLVERIQSSILNTIPLWKSQMVIALGLNNSQKAMEAQIAVTNMTNELLKKNSELLKQGTIGIAKESERGVIDIETIQKTNADLIYTIDEVLKIQREGSAKRALAETELIKLESQLKDKLLEVKTTKENTAKGINR